MVLAKRKLNTYQGWGCMDLSNETPLHIHTWAVMSDGVTFRCKDWPKCDVMLIQTRIFEETTLKVELVEY